MPTPKVLCILVVGTALFCAAACAKRDACVHTLRNTQSSADGKLKAAILDVKCGPGAPDASWILIAAADANFRDEEDKAAVFEGAVQQLKWQDGALYVIYGHAKIRRVADFAKGVKLYYFEIEPATDLGRIN
jgi:hypothetical protein